MIELDFQYIAFCGGDIAGGQLSLANGTVLPIWHARATAKFRESAAYWIIRFRGWWPLEKLVRNCARSREKSRRRAFADFFEPPLLIDKRCRPDGAVVDWPRCH